ncbi:MAG: BtrH N-terminal domain-containing protein [Bacteroidota bacterium]
MKIADFKPFIGLHCETTATGSLLQHLGFSYSEPMLFGLGQGLSYIFWKMKAMDYPFIGGRVKPDELTENLCRHLGFELAVKETTSAKKAWKNLADPLAEGQPVGLKLDCYHLDYFTNKIHFAGHYVACYGYDAEQAFLVDTRPQGSESVTSLESLALARREKGPMSSRNLSYTITAPSPPTPLKKALPAAIKANAEAYLSPPITNIAYKGILKTSKQLLPWFRQSEDVTRDFTMTATIMERAGSGGSIFRNLYRDFLAETYALLGGKGLKEAHALFQQAAQAWKDVAELFDQAGKEADETPLYEAARLLVNISDTEKMAMEKLLRWAETT